MERQEMIDKIETFIEDDVYRKPELLFKPKPYPSSSVELLPKRYEQVGTLADFVLQQVSDAVKEKGNKIKDELLKEIQEEDKYICMEAASGNVVKEHQYRGVKAGLTVSVAIIDKHTKEGGGR